MKKKTMTNQGGVREGAGRKKKVHHYINLGIYEENVKALNMGKKLFSTTQLMNDALKYYHNNANWAKK